MTEASRRLHVGGLFEGITPQQLEDRLKSFGKVSQIEIKTKKVLGNGRKRFCLSSRISIGIL